MADEYEDYLAEQQGGGVSAPADDSLAGGVDGDDSYEEFQRQQRQAMLAQSRREKKKPAGAGLPIAPVAAVTPAAADGFTPPAARVSAPAKRAVTQPTFSPRDVTGTKADVRGGGLEGLLRSNTMIGRAEAIPGAVATGVAEGAAGLARAAVEHPFQTAGWVVAPEVMAPIAAFNAGETVGTYTDQQRRGIPVDQQGQPTERRVSGFEAGMEVAALAPVLPHVARQGASRFNAVARDVEAGARFSSALDRAMSDAGKARARKTAGNAPEMLALKPGQYEMPGVDWETPLADTKKAAAEASAERQSFRGQPRALLPATAEKTEGAVRAGEVSAENRVVRASDADVESYRRMRDNNTFMPGREVGSPRPFPEEPLPDFEQRVSGRRNVRDTALERMAIQDEGAEGLRRPSGALRSNLTDASEDALASELQRLHDANAQENIAPTAIDTGWGETWVGTKPGAAKAYGRQAMRGKTIDKLETELRRRGVEPSDALARLHEGMTDFDFSSPDRRGFSPIKPLALPIAAGAGAAAGAALDPDNPAEGAAAGAAAGFAASAFAIREPGIPSRTGRTRRRGGYVGSPGDPAQPYKQADLAPLFTKPKSSVLAAEDAAAAAEGRAPLDQTAGGTTRPQQGPLRTRAQTEAAEAADQDAITFEHDARGRVTGAKMGDRGVDFSYDDTGKLKGARPRKGEPAPAALESRQLPVGDGREFSSTQLNLPDDIGAKMQDFANGIPEDALAADGREATPHITVKFGLHGNDPAAVHKIIADHGPVPVTFGKTSLFPAGESGTHDVLKVDVDSPELRALNKKIADALPNTDTHPEYVPHATLAYLKPGEGAAYDGLDDFAGHQATIDNLTFHGTDYKETTIPLGKRKGVAAPAAIATLGAPAAGAAAGATQGDTPSERKRNALLGFTVGAGAAAFVARTALRKSGEKPPAESAAGRVVGSIDEKGGRPAAKDPLRAAGLSPNSAADATAAADVKAGDFVNLSKFALDETGEKRLSEQVQRVVADEKLAPKQAVTWQQTKEAAASLGLTPDRILRQTKLSGAEMLAVRNIVKGNTEQIIALEKKLATDGTMSAADRETAEATIAAADKQSDALLSKFVKERSRTGRDLNNLKILANATDDPVVWMARAKRLLGDAPLTDEMRSDIIRMANDKPDQLPQYVANLKPSTLWEKAIGLWKTGLLTNPKTHMANIISNTAMIGLERAKDVPAFALDRMLGMVTGHTTKALSARGMASAAAEGAAKGWEVAKRVMKGEAPADLSKHNVREIDYKNPVLNAYTHTIFRSLNAADKVYREMALAHSIDEQARVAAKLEGWKGEAFDKRVADLKASPTDEMALHAVEAADYTTFQDNSFLAKAASGVRRAFGKVGDVVLPFTRTPGNVAQRVFEYTPAGALTTINDLSALLKGAGTAQQQRAVVEQLGRSSIGSAALYAGYELASRGKWSGQNPETPAERETQQTEGKPSNAVEIGGRWYSLQRVSPIGNLLSVGAALYELNNKADATPFGTAVGGAAAAAKSIADQSFLQGLSGLAGATKDPVGAGERYGQQLVTSVIPAGVQGAVRAMQPNAKNERGASPVDVIKSRVGAGNLPDKSDALGQPVEHAGAGELLDPFNSKSAKGKKDPVIHEMETIGLTLGPLGIRKASKASETRPARKAETREEYAKRAHLEGSMLRGVLQNLFANPGYQKLAPEQRKAEAENVVTRTRAAITRRLNGAP